MVFSKEFPNELAVVWRNYLTRNGAKRIYWEHPDLENKDYDNLGELCPINNLMCHGK